MNNMQTTTERDENGHAFKSFLTLPPRNRILHADTRCSSDPITAQGKKGQGENQLCLPATVPISPNRILSSSTETGKTIKIPPRGAPGTDKTSAPERRPFAGETGHFSTRAEAENGARLPLRERAEAPAMACSRPNAPETRAARMELVISRRLPATLPCRAVPRRIHSSSRGVSRQRLKAPGLNARSLSTRTSQFSSSCRCWCRGRPLVPKVQTMDSSVL